MQFRVTLRFCSDSGREYLYDDVTGSIFPWNELLEAVLCLEISKANHRKELVTKHGEKNVEAAYRFIKRWRKNYGAFFRTWAGSDWGITPQAEQLETFVRNTSFELLLVVTEDCNLRCRYCILSEVYPLNRVRTNRRMSFDTARRAIDWYFNLVQPQVARNPRKQFGLSFYGGEPMLNMPVVSQILEYVRKRFPGYFLPVMTTNGTLLTLKNVRVLVDNDVSLAISIDGPKEEHDRLRVDTRGRGSFTRIIGNLGRIKRTYPQYWNTKLTSVSVYDWGTDLESVEKFFNENTAIVPRPVFVNQVAHRNTHWYEHYTLVDRASMLANIDELRIRYKKAKVEGHSTSYYMDCLVGMPIALAVLRRRSCDEQPPFLPFSGTCTPGAKIAVHVDGKIDMCERVNGTYPIGHLKHGGIDYKRLREIIGRYGSQVLFACPKCPVTKQCSICFSFVEKSADFSKIAELCDGTVERARQSLADYISILEENPHADLHFETDTSRLEEQVINS